MNKHEYLYQVTEDLKGRIYKATENIIDEVNMKSVVINELLKYCTEYLYESVNSMDKNISNLTITGGVKCQKE